MEAAVSTVLAGNQLTAWDVFGDWRSLSGFKPSRRTAFQAAGGPHSSRNLWQPQVAKFNLGALVTPRKKAPVSVKSPTGAH